MSSSENMQFNVRVATGLSLAIATTCVILRLIARRLLRQRLFWDDVLILLALIFEWGIGIAGVILLHYGLGKHIINVSAHDRVIYMKVLYSGAPLYALTITSVKLSLLFVYYRLFPVKYMTRCCLIVGVVVVVWGLATIVTGFFLCIPASKLWHPDEPGQCLNLFRFYYGIQVPVIITDVIIFVLPIKSIYVLPISRMQKVLLSGVFGLAIVTIAFDVIRFVALIQTAQGGPDVTWNQTEAAIWTCVEPGAAILVACLPHLRPVFRWLKEYWKPSLHSRAGVSFDNGSHGHSSEDSASSVHSNLGTDLNEKALPNSAMHFNENNNTGIVSDLEAGSTEHLVRTPSNRTTSSHSVHGIPGQEAPSFPDFVDLISTSRRIEVSEIGSTPTPISSQDGGPGPAVESPQLDAKLGSILTEVKAMKSIDNVASLQSINKPLPTMKSDPRLRSKYFHPPPVQSRPLPGSMGFRG